MHTPRRVLFIGLLASFAFIGCGGGASGDGSPSSGPTAVIEAMPASGTCPLIVHFDGSASFTPEGTVTTYSWDFGDGAMATGPLADHTYTSPGIFSARLTVTTSLNRVDEAAAQIVVTSAAGEPFAVMGADVHSGTAPLTVAFNGSGHAAPGRAITGYSWSFGDGATSTARNPQHTFAAGVYTVTLTVTDDSSATGQDQTVIAAASWSREVLRLTNERRWSYEARRLPPLKGEAILDAAALRHTLDMALNMPIKISHTGTDGSTDVERVVDAGYTGWTLIAENIAAGHTSPGAVVDGWMNSAGHRANIMRVDAREIGIAHVQVETGYRHYWTQDFGARQNVYPVVINRGAFAAADPVVDLYIYGGGWAQDMRISNTEDLAGVWEPYASAKRWTLASGLGAKTVYVTLRNGSVQRTASDSIVLVAP